MMILKHRIRIHIIFIKKCLNGCAFSLLYNFYNLRV